MSKKLSGILLFCILCTSGVQAGFIAGADLTYRFLGNNNYEITYTLYRDCSGPAEPASLLLQFQCTADSSLSFYHTLNKISFTGQEVTPGCGCMPTSCNGGPAGRYGIREYKYVAEVILLPCDEWIISNSLCCRNHNNNLYYNSSQNVYLEARLNNLLAPGNSSPTSTNKPISILWQGQIFCFNHGAIDPNGDSLSYELISPQIAPGVPVIWLGGYTPGQPLPSLPAITLDAVSGDICYSPINIILSTYAVSIRQWRRINNIPVNIGSTIREMQTKVADSTNYPPVLSGIDTTLKKGYCASDTIYYMDFIQGKPIKFAIWGFDPDTYNLHSIECPWKFSLSMYNAIPGASFSVFSNSTDSAYAIFEWNPDDTTVNTNPHCFTVKIHDHGCPNCNTVLTEYCIKILPANTGIPGQARNSTSIWPNPAENELNITNNIASGSILTINDLTGKVCLQQTLSFENNNINISSLAMGTYIYRILDKNLIPVQRGKLCVLR